MDVVRALVDQLMSQVEDLWLAALALSFFTMICESAKPKPRDGEERPKTSAVAIWVSVLSLATPLLLFFHAFLTGSGALIAIVAAIGAAILVSALIGWLIAAAAPDVGRTLNRAAPVLAVAAFALTASVTWRSIFDYVNGVVVSLVQ
ncbi:MAG: hypothetical protein JNM59_08765 [Hyphomonadaceae bacterium]|nr:hypothetical protein [Hyphomonadaceae bacterium]